MTTPAAETKSIGLLSDAQLSWFLHRHQDNFIVTWQIRTIYRDSAIWTTLSWHGNPAHLPGLCKNACQPWHRRQLPIPPGRYAAITFSLPSARLPQILFAVVPGEIDNTLTNPYRVTNPFYLDCRKPASPSASLFYPDDKFVPPGQSLKLYFTRLAPLACIWQFTVLFLKIYKTGPWAPSASWPSRLQACFSYNMTVPSTLGYCSKHAGIGNKLVAILPSPRLIYLDNQHFVLLLNPWFLF